MPDVLLFSATNFTLLGTDTSSEGDLVKIATLQLRTNDGAFTARFSLKEALAIPKLLLKADGSGAFTLSTTPGRQ